MRLEVLPEQFFVQGRGVAPPACADGEKPQREPLFPGLFGDKALKGLANESGHGTFPAPGDGAEVAFDSLVQKDRRPLHIQYAIIRQRPPYAPS